MSTYISIPRINRHPVPLTAEYIHDIYTEQPASFLFSQHLQKCYTLTAEKHPVLQQIIFNQSSNY